MSSNTRELTGVSADRLADIAILIDILFQDSPSLCPRKDRGNLWYLLLTVPIHRTLHYALCSDQRTKLLAVDVGLGATIHGTNWLSH